MKYQVRLMAAAEQDIESALQWLCDQRATAAANRWFDRLMACIDTLESHPERCRRADESDDVGLDLRELLFGKRRGVWRILFVIDRQTVNILRVRHGARDKLRREDFE